MIYIQTVPLHPIDDPYNVVRIGCERHIYSACWWSWWERPRRRKANIMSLAPHMNASTHEELALYRSYIEWLRSMGYEAYLVLNKGIGETKTGWMDESADVHSLDIAYTPEDNAAKIFIGFNLLRFLSMEFLSNRPKRELSARDFWGQLCSKCPSNIGHWPFTDMSSYITYNYDSAYYRKMYPERIWLPDDWSWNLHAGHLLFDWFSEVLPGYSRGVSMGDPGAARSSRLSFGEFTSWLSNRAILSTSTEERKVQVHAQRTVRDRPRDSRGRFIRKEATATRIAPDIIGEANAGVLRTRREGSDTASAEPAVR